MITISSNPIQESNNEATTFLTLETINGQFYINIQQLDGMDIIN
jgi:hypothetical protein